jgi:hypothetical protein
MNKTKHPPITIGMILMIAVAVSLILSLTYSCECPAQTITPSPSPVPTPADDDVEGWFEVIQESPDREFVIAEYWDPITTGKGTYEEPRTYYYWSDSYGKAISVEREYSEGIRGGVLRGLRPLGWAVYEFEEIATVRSGARGAGPSESQKPDDIIDIKPGSEPKPGNGYTKMKVVKKSSASLIKLPAKIIPGRTPWKAVYGKPAETEVWVKKKAVTP